MIDLDVSGNTSSKKAIVVVYDIFGFYPQTLQGADSLAAQTDAVTFVPDLLDKEYALHEWIPTDTEEKKNKLYGFFGKVAAPFLILPKLQAWMAEAKSKYPGVEKWGILGLCWGGKVKNQVPTYSHYRSHLYTDFLSFADRRAQFCRRNSARCFRSSSSWVGSARTYRRDQ